MNDLDAYQNGLYLFEISLINIWCLRISLIIYDVFITRTHTHTHKHTHNSMHVYNKIHTMSHAMVDKHYLLFTDIVNSSESRLVSYAAVNLYSSSSSGSTEDIIIPTRLTVNLSEVNSTYRML